MGAGCAIKDTSFSVKNTMYSSVGLVEKVGLNSRVANQSDSNVLDGLGN
jgi:hypothetical protein